MAAVINTNTASLNAQRNLGTSQSSLTTSLQRLSSGLRINSAKDDAAGLAISDRMTSQIKGLNQAARNANDGISLAQTAEGALQSVGDSLQRMRELAVQASNATNSASDRASLQKEVDQLVSQINTVSSQTSFNGVKLLDGTFSSQTFQVGANKGETINISSIASAKADSLGVGTTSSYSTSVTGSVTSGAISAAGITVNGYGVGPTKSDGVSVGGGDDSAIAKAAAFNSVSGQTGVTAKASATTVSGAAPSATVAIAGNNTDYIYVNNVKLGAIAAGGNVTSQGSNVAAAFNAVSNQTGVTASFDSTTGAVSLSAADGRNISLIGAGTGAAVANTGLTVTDAATGFATAAVAGAAGALKAGDLTINGVDIGAVTAGTNATTQGANVAAAINAVSSKTGVTASNAAGVLTLTGAQGQDIAIGGNNTNKTATQTATGLTFQNLATTTRGGVSLSSTSANGITVGGSDFALAGLTAVNTAATATFGAGVSSIDLSTASGAQNALATIDSALATINSSRADLGAIQNRFTSVVSNLNTSSENLSAARSRIQDTDFAAETANMTRGQILQQAGTAMLAQANQLPQSVLSLLK
ncbi:flagellin [Zoogloea sp.]|uniref:flagellin N-terminal helical domain-containing protein n=1 Tax=Zoogloea sp. TaxID=49181 RepID=UPI002632DD51|nr:flagellin [Zoogloea sp.]